MVSIIAAAAVALCGQTAPGPWFKAEVSVYSEYYDGRKTASGRVYRHFSGQTAACKTVRSGRRTRPSLPFFSTYELEYKGRRVVVTITDTGGYKPRKASEWFDLNGVAWDKLSGGAAPSRFVARARRLS